MKIVFTTDTIQRGGKERQIFVMANALLKKKYDIHIVTSKYAQDNYIEEYAFQNERIHIINEGKLLNRYYRFREILIILNPDLVFSWDFQSSLFNLLLFKKYKYEFINGSIQHGIRLLRLSHILRSIVCWFSPFITANSYTGLKANNIRQSKNVFVLYNGIESKFLIENDQEKKTSAKVNLIPGYALNPGIIFISVANLLPYKDYFTVLSALKEIKKHFNFYYFVIGDGHMKKEIEERIKTYGLIKNIILLGKINNVEVYLKISDIMIHSSRGEGISNAILEGMYAGLPIIATNVGGIPETVYPGSSMLFPYEDEKALLECLLKVPEMFAQFDPDSEEYKKHLDKFSVETMLNRFEEIITAVMGQ
jgi:glycosyltransferase involved in cell wall biosynthesis